MDTRTWEYYTYENNAPKGRCFDEIIGADRTSEASARLSFWYKHQSEITQAVQPLLDDGWEPLLEIGPGCLQITTSFDHAEGILQKALSASIIGYNWVFTGIHIDFRRQKPSWSNIVTGNPLDQTAYEFLMAGTDYRDNLRRILVGAGSRSVISLLQSGLRVLEEYSNQYREVLVREAHSTPWGAALISQTIVSSHSSMVEAIYEITAAIGQYGLDELFKVIADGEEKSVILAGLVMISSQNQSRRTFEQLESLVRYHSAYSNHKLNGRNRVRIVSLLSLVLARAGYKNWRDAMISAAQQIANGMSIEELSADRQKDAWLYLVGMEDL